MATYYVTITPIDALSNSTYSLYYDEILPANLIASGVTLATLMGTGYTVDNTGHTSVLVKNEDPDCCCAVHSYIFPS